MQKKSFVSLSLVGIGNLLNAIFGLILLTAVARSLSLEDFGRYALITSLLVFCARLTDFGSNSTYVANSILEQSEDIKRLIATKIGLFLIAVSISFVLLLIFGFSSVELLLTYMVGLIGYSFSYFLFPIFQKEEKFVLAVGLNTIPATIKATVGGLALMGKISLTLSGAFATFSFPLLGTAIFWLFVPDSFKRIKVTGYSFSELKSLISPGIAMVVAEGWQAVANALVKYSRDFANVGIFSIANKVATIFALLSYSIFVVLLPKNAREMRSSGKYNFKESIIISAGILTLAMAAMVVGPNLIVVVFGEKFAESVGILNILILASALTSIHTFMENYFYVDKKTHYLAKIALSKLLFFVFLGLVLGTKYGLVGFASASLISAVIAVGITVYFIIGSGDASLAAIDSSSSSI